MSAIQHLANEHAHDFTVRLFIPVGHVDRDVEFHLESRQVLQFIMSRWPVHPLNGLVQFGPSSCEAIAIVLRDEYVATNGARPSRCEVYEDGKHGAVA